MPISLVWGRVGGGGGGLSRPLAGYKFVGEGCQQTIQDVTGAFPKIDEVRVQNFGSILPKLSHCKI